MALEPPLLSVLDPLAEGEGSIDPLGLVNIYEHLAERIYPFITVRMHRPRFLTAISAGAHVCAGMEDELAADGVTPAWLTFEWLVVEAFVRKPPEVPPHERGRIPGTLKTRNALEKNRRLSHATYLKTPKIFGFTGVYKRLAYGLLVTGDDLELDEGGHELLRLWEKDQGLPDFWSGRSGAGAKFREELRAAVKRTMKKGSVAEPSSIPLWSQLTERFWPSRAGRYEAKWLFERLREPNLRVNKKDPEATLMRRELIDALVASGKSVSRAEEARFFGQLAQQASSGLKKRLHLIQAYERLARVLTDAFDTVRFLAGQNAMGTAHPDQFGKVRPVRRIVAELAQALEAANRRFEGDEQEKDLQMFLDRFRGVKSPGDFFWAVMEHHEVIQRHKPPEGKRPWMEPIRGGGVFVRPAYRLLDPPPETDVFVHDYRTPSMCEFLVDLRRIGR